MLSNVLTRAMESYSTNSAPVLIWIWSRIWRSALIIRFWLSQKPLERYRCLCFWKKAPSRIRSHGKSFYFVESIGSRGLWDGWWAISAMSGRPVRCSCPKSIDHYILSKIQMTWSCTAWMAQLIGNFLATDQVGLMSISMSPIRILIWWILWNTK